MGRTPAWEASVLVCCGCPQCYHPAVGQHVLGFGSSQLHHMGWGSPHGCQHWVHLPLWIAWFLQIHHPKQTSSQPGSRCLPSHSSREDTRNAESILTSIRPWPTNHECYCWSQKSSTSMSSQTFCVISLLAHKRRNFNILSSKQVQALSTMPGLGGASVSGSDRYLDIWFSTKYSGSFAQGGAGKEETKSKYVVKAQLLSSQPYLLLVFLLSVLPLPSYYIADVLKVWHMSWRRNQKSLEGHLFKDCACLVYRAQALEEIFMKNHSTNPQYPA